MGALLLMSLIAVSEVEQADVRCGAFCTYACLRALDIAVGPYDDFEKRLGSPDSAGYSLAQLSDTATSYGAHTLGVTTTLANLQRRTGRFACIVRLPPAHFVVLSEVASDRTIIVDPPNEYSVPASTFQTRWDGTALLISNEPLIREEDIAPNKWGLILWLSLCALCASLIIGAVLWNRRSPLRSPSRVAF